MQQAATDPTTGAIDMDKILTGISATDRTKLEQIASSLMSILDGEPSPTQCIIIIIPPASSVSSSNLYNQTGFVVVCLLW